MAQLYTKTKLYLEANSKTWDAEQNNLRLRNDGSDDYIHTWSVDGLTEPTDSQIASYETAGNTEESNYNVKRTRREAYGEISDQLDLLYKDMLADKGDKSGTWFAAVKAVKDKYAKE